MNNRSEIDRVVENILKSARDDKNDRINFYNKTKNDIGEIQKKVDLVFKNLDNKIDGFNKSLAIRHQETIHQIQKAQTNINTIFSLLLLGFIIIGLMIIYI